MARGRPMLPVEVHRKRGTYRQDRHGQLSEPSLEELPLIGDAPAHLTEREKAIWTELCLAAVPGVLRAPDAIYLEIVVGLLDSYRHDPEFKVGQLNQLTKCLAQLGFTPLERTKLGFMPPKKEEHDPWADF